MVFSSFSFLLFFLPITLVLYFILPFRPYRNFVLTVSSLFFYAWGEPATVLLMIAMILFNWIIGLLIDYSGQQKSYRKIFMILGVITDVLVLVYFKYTDFILMSLNDLKLGTFTMMNIALPIGISFYLFQIISYLVDVYRETVPAQKNILSFACYVSLFPQLIAGPIVRYADIAREITDRKENLDDFSLGIRRFIYGLAKKVLLANSLALIADPIFMGEISELTFTSAWVGTLAYALQIYFDFSGYSDMAIGLGRMFGFHFNENFRYPYVANSITDFWRRWHISLGSWFRDYVYIPLGGSRKGLLRQIFNLFVVWALTGLWHGAAWNFVLWGLWFFFWLVLEKLFLLKVLKKLPLINHIYSLLVVMFGWVIFACGSTDQIFAFMKAMVSFGPVNTHIFEQMGVLSSLPFAAIACILAFPILSTLSSKLGLHEPFEWMKDIVAFALLAVCFLFLVNASYNPFIYFRF